MTQLLEAPAPVEETSLTYDDLDRATRPTTLLLSAAIRQGSQLTLPGLILWQKQEGDLVYACAMGAACYAAAGNRFTGVGDTAEAARYFPQLADEVTITDTLVPEYRRIMKHYGSSEPIILQWALADHIMLLNDEAGVSRERIADIVEALGY